MGIAHNLVGGGAQHELGENATSPGADDHELGVLGSVDEHLGGRTVHGLQVHLDPGASARGPLQRRSMSSRTATSKSVNGGTYPGVIVVGCTAVTIDQLRRTCSGCPAQRGVLGGPEHRLIGVVGAVVADDHSAGGVCCRRAQIAGVLAVSRTNLYHALTAQPTTATQMSTAAAAGTASPARPTTAARRPRRPRPALAGAVGQPVS